MTKEYVGAGGSDEVVEGGLEGPLASFSSVSLIGLCLKGFILQHDVCTVRFVRYSYDTIRVLCLRHAQYEMSWKQRTQLSVLRYRVARLTMHR